MKSLKSKVVVITGAGSGIGRALAIELAQKKAKLALNDWNMASLEETLSQLPQETEVIYEKYDVSSALATESFAHRVTENFGQVDVVINNAGIALPQKKVEKTDYEDFEKVLKVNLWGVIYGSKIFIPHLLKQPEASLVNVSSIFGIVGQPLQGPYVTAKFAVKGFTETLRHELKDSPINVLCVHPGGIKTNIIRNMDTPHTQYRDKFAAAFEKLAKTTPASAAKTIIQGIEKKKKRVLIGRDAKSMDLLARLIPQRYGNIVYRDFDLDKFSVR